MAASIRGLLRLTRASIALSPLADVLAGQALARATGSGGATPVATVAGLLAALCLFLFGMAQNDLADRRADASRGVPRPIPRGEVSLRAARILILVCGGLALAFAAMASQQAATIAAGMLALISLYNLAPSHLGLAGPVALGLIRGADLCLGAATFGDWRAALLPACAYAVYVGSLSVVARMEDGMLAPSRRVVLGATVAAASCPFAAVALIARTAPAAPSALGGPPWLNLGLGAACAVGLALWLRAALSRLPPILAPGPSIARYVGAALSGVFLFDAAIAFSCGAVVPALAILAMFGLSRRLVRWFPPS